MVALTFSDDCALVLDRRKLLEVQHRALQSVGVCVRFVWARRLKTIFKTHFASNIAFIRFTVTVR